MTEPYPTSPQAPQGASSGGLASWGSRVAATIIDVLPPLAVAIVLTFVFGSTETSDGQASFELSGLPFVLNLLFGLGWLLYNTGAMQGRTGQSLGKKVMKIALVGAATRQPVGFGLSIARSFLHILDAIPCYIGFLWPLWDKENRTFADMILDTRVVKA
ncbi:RDD family protein [Aeromicrobium sp. SMF47]|uniref:RDD family protein n=1 Tax=Aeromicrobium TaxID=2040 RepID=UPI00129DF993|nr:MULTISPECIES: RDD family protein [Aeromicrobium]MRJ75883.1 RDD family protein [Aeromicrobium yanjiei]MRK00228.1 RDD family protein [Aeromicrobium sp. S22]